jgi:N-acetylglucosaminyldiphosphoundecaprenol N-acetyl-beta-D-mannosaminyltransferase
MSTNSTFTWPKKYDLFGVQATATCYDEAVAVIIRAALRGVSGVVDLMSAHGLVAGARDAKFREVLNSFELVASDGQPVRWALNFFHKTGLADRVYGPELTIRLCKAAAEQGVPIYLYGSSPDVIKTLQANLLDKYPALKIVGAESPPFRPLTPEEDAAVVKRINDSGAGIVFLGTGCPKQEYFAHDHRQSIKGVQLCVGAAFDFHAGKKKTAPAWMQRRGLEWLFRLIQEPGRLWKRYLVTNTMFSLLVGRRFLLGR